MCLWKFNPSKTRKYRETPRDSGSPWLVRQAHLDALPCSYTLNCAVLLPLSDTWQHRSLPWANTTAFLFWGIFTVCIYNLNALGLMWSYQDKHPNQAVCCPSWLPEPHAISENIPPPTQLPHIYMGQKQLSENNNTLFDFYFYFFFLTLS